jgi:hypothetical protein
MTRQKQCTSGSPSLKPTGHNQKFEKHGTMVNMNIEIPPTELS